MCAISGIVNTHGSDGVEAILQKMIAAQVHRGPDESGSYIDDDIAFGHARLSVIDPENGKQPMVSSTGSIVMIANGEIYNFQQIKEKLSVRGHKFLTGSDSECIIHMYEEYGDECINHLDGMFAFALFDLKRRKLLLGRDRLGQKPLLYFMSGDMLIFASEFAGLMAHPSFPEELDKRALSDYLSLQYIPQPDTAFLRVRKLPPGHLLTMNLETGNISIRCYWQPDYSLKNSGLSLNAATAELRKLVEKAVEKRLVSDVPLGTFLSGGVDSCIVTGIAAKLLYPAPCDAFTAGFGVAQYDERAAAKESAAVINRFSGGNLRCHEQEIKPDDFDLLEKLSAHFGEPFADASALPFFLLSRFARKHIKVALAGDGADEIFAGYERYLAMCYAEKAYWMPLPVRKALFAAAAGVLKINTLLFVR